MGNFHVAKKRCYFYRLFHGFGQAKFADGGSMANGAKYWQICSAQIWNN